MSVSEPPQEDLWPLDTQDAELVQNAEFQDALTLQEAKKRALVLRRRIFENWSHIADMVTQHEGAIQNRWMRKSKHQRREMLLSTWPDMIKYHRPDVAALSQAVPGTKSTKEALRAYLWPHINIEDLSKTEPILLMLNSRGLHNPVVFVYTDWQPAVLVSNIHGMLDFDGYIMTFYHAPSYDAYGGIFPATNVPQQDEWPLVGHASRVHVGLVLLKLQDRLYWFLAQFVDKILHDASSGTVPHFPTPTLPSAIVGPLGERSFATRAFESYYRQPEPPNIAQIRFLVEARAFEAKVHVMTLREDPRYWRDTVEEWKSHQEDMLLDTKGNQHPNGHHLGKHAHWNLHAFNTAISALVNVEQWADMRDRLADVETWASSFDGGPRERQFNLALSNLLHYAKYSLYFPCEVLKTTWRSSPPLQPFFRLVAPEHRDRFEGCIVPWDHDTLDPCFRQAAHPPERGGSFFRLQWILTKLSDQIFVAVKPHTLIEEFDYLLKSQPHTRNLVSPFILRQISDISILSEYHRQLDNFGPAATLITPQLSDIAVSDGQASFDSIRKRVCRIRQCLGTSEVWQSLDLTPARIELPADGPRGKQDVDQIRAAEASLDKFWGVLRTLLRKTTGPELLTCSETFLRTPISRTPEWKDLTQTRDGNELVTEPLAQGTAPAEEATTA